MLVNMPEAHRLRIRYRQNRRQGEATPEKALEPRIITDRHLVPPTVDLIRGDIDGSSCSRMAVSCLQSTIRFENASAALR
jgi:hypothetical protein